MKVYVVFGIILEWFVGKFYKIVFVVLKIWKMLVFLELR